ncbi:MAG: glyoxalase [Nitrospinaceae bacterium]|nr:MAG: glyoxalase [Nitrospinaceae bacterium]
MTTIPEGFTSVTPYIVMDDPVAAIEFYKKALGAEEKMRFPTPEGGAMYVEFQVGNARMMIGSPCPDDDAKSAKSLDGSPISFYVYVEDLEASFNKGKSAGMSVKKEVEEMFWGDRMGTLRDPFNVEWTLAQHIRDVSPEELQEAIKSMAG